MDKISTLRPNVQLLAKDLVKRCLEANTPIIITQGLRTISEQDALYAQGRTKPGNIVTNAKGGTSYHNYGIAFDICPYIGGKLLWNETNLFKKIGAIGKSIGLEWGGDWKDFIDLPHFQLTGGKTIQDFQKETEAIEIAKLEKQIIELQKILAELLKARVK